MRLSRDVTSSHVHLDKGVNKGVMTLEIPTKMVMYEAKASAVYMGSQYWSTKHWYMKQELAQSQKLWFRYLLTLAACGVFLLIMWIFLLIRAHVIVIRKKKTKDGSVEKKQVTLSTSLPQSKNST